MKQLLMTTIAIFGLALISNAQVPNFVPSNGLVGWWPFNGNANDESSNGNNGAVNGPILSADRFGTPNSSYSLNKTNYEYINVPQTNNLNNLSNISISLWTFINSSGPYNHYVNKTDPSGGPTGIQFAFASNSQGIYFYYGSNPQLFQTNTAISLGNWHHICVTYNYDGNPTNSKCKFYIDGICTDSLPTTVNLLPSTYDLKFGSYANANINTVDGNVDDIGIWNIALTQQEVSALYNGCQYSIITQPSSQNINVNSNTQFIVNSSDPAATYQWQTDLGVGFQNLTSVGQYSGATNDTLTISNTTLGNNNQPFRCIISSGTCIDTSDVAVLTVINNVGINEVSISDLFSFYPNPVQDVMNLRADTKLLGSVYNIYDNSGKLVLTGKINFENIIIEIGNLSGGIYLISVGENLQQTFKIIKE